VKRQRSNGSYAKVSEQLSGSVTDMFHTADIAIRAKHLILADGLKRDKWVTVKDGLITEVADSDKQIPAGISRILPEVDYIFSPFVDTHVHLSLDSNSVCSGKDLETIFKHNLSALLDCGIGAVRDAGCKNDALSTLHISNLVPIIIRTGSALNKKGGYGSFISDSGEGDLSGRVSRCPGRFVKVLLSGVVSFDHFGVAGGPQFSPDELREIVEIATRAGKKVMCHANSDEICKIAVRCDVHSIEHGYFMERDTLKEMAEKGIYWTPTIAAVANQLNDPRGRFSKKQKEIIRMTYLRQAEMIGFADEIGVPLSIGTDSGAYGVPHGRGFFDETRLFAKSGIHPEKIFHYASAAGADMLGIKQFLTAGAPAYMVGSNKNPLESVLAKEDVTTILKQQSSKASHSAATPTPSAP
jgi:imidazolonepropionase-like amidohydrolase